MRYRRFGRTELQIPVIFMRRHALSVNKWQDVPFKDVPADSQKNLEATIHRALELGINHIETARGYGSSEMQLGAVLPSLPRDRIIVQTKVAPHATPEDFLNTFEKSMKYLRLEDVDLLALHGINNRQLLDWSLKKNGCLAAARDLQRQGRVRHVGFSTHATTDIILEAIEGGDFDYINLHWYFVNDLNWAAVRAAQARDMGVFIISPNDKGGKLYSPPQKLIDLTAPLTPMQFNDLYCLARSEVHTLSCGAARPSDFDEHVAALEHYDRIAEVVPPIEHRWRDALESALGRDWCDHWFEGLPNTWMCPGRSISWKSCGCGHTPRGWTWWIGPRCVTTFSAKAITGSRAKTRAWRGKLICAPHCPGALLRHGSRRSWLEAHRWLYEAPVKRLSQS